MTTQSRHCDKPRQPIVLATRPSRLDAVRSHSADGGIDGERQDMRIAIAGGTGLIGSQLVDHARAAGRQTVVLARSEGLDVTDAPLLRAALYGVNALIDVTQSPSANETVAREFFTQTAANLAEASASVGVGRTVVLSQVGCDRASGPDSDPDPDSLDGYLRAKASHERASRGAGQGETHVVGSAARIGDI